MIARARSDTADPAIDYRIADLDCLDLPSGAHDMAYGSLAFHYVEDFGRLAAVVHRALTPGSHFVFTVEHPVSTAPRSEEHTSELQSLMRISYAVFCLKKK